MAPSEKRLECGGTWSYLPLREEKGKQRNSFGKITVLHCIFVLKGFWELGNVKWLAVVTINIDQHVKENMVTFRSQ